MLQQLCALRDTRDVQTLIYDNGIPIVDLPAIRTRSFPWQIWRTSYAYEGCRHRGLQGSLSWYTVTGWGTDPSTPDPWKSENQFGAKCMPGGKLECPYNAGGWGVLLYPPQSGNISDAPATSIRWELLAKGLADSEYFSTLDHLTTSAARRAGSCTSITSAGRAVAATSCCREVARSHAALEAVAQVVWNFSNVPSNVDFLPTTGPTGSSPDSAPVGKHYHYDEPYSTNTTLMHQVLDNVARQIEAVRAACGGRDDTMVRS